MPYTLSSLSLRRKIKFLLSHLERTEIELISSSRLFSYKDFVKNLVSRDFKTRYKRSYLGILWSLLNPLLVIVVYTLAFDYIMKIQV